MPAHVRALTKSSIASTTALLVELAILPILSYGLRVAPWLSYALVQLVGQAITFSLNKYWVFEARNLGSITGQGTKSLLVFVGSYALNTALPSLAHYGFGVERVAAFALAQGLVYLAWNYPMNRYWVFRR